MVYIFCTSVGESVPVRDSERKCWKCTLPSIASAHVWK